MRVRVARRTSQPVPAPVGYPGPDAVEVAPRSVRVGTTRCRTVAVVGYPREVGPAWLEPLLTYPGDADIALHVEPIPTAIAAQRLRRQLARLESSRLLASDRGRLEDFQVDAAAEDARDLAQQLARGQGRLFRVGLYVTIRADSQRELEAEAATLKALLGSMLLDAQPATFRSLQGWITTLPLGMDVLSMRRTFDTRALAAAFPFASAELPSSSGVLYGHNLQSQGLVVWDRFACDNYNSVVLARSGAGKSYMAKLELLRWLYTGVQAAVIDPQDEYARLADAVGGTRIALGSPGVRLNPFDLGAEPDALTRRALFIHTLVAVLLAQPLDPAATAALDRAIIAAYAARGISVDPRTHRRLTAAGMLLALDTIWRQVTRPTRRSPRLVVVDEAWLLMRSQAGAQFLYRLAKAGRKYWCGLTTITQDIDDLLASNLGKAVIANAATQLLLAQAPQAISALTEAFHLSEGERAFLLAARRGEAILAAGNQRVAFRAEASPTEHRLVTTSPEFLASLERSGENPEVDGR